jgi:CxxC-x17-CxxC domain-containing protein
VGFNDRDNNRRPSYNSGGNSGGVSRHGAKNLTSATCFTCGNSCKVPFTPSSGKPVYCNDCFRKSDSHSRDDRSSSYSRDDRSSSFKRPSYSDNNRSNSSPSASDFAKINAKLDRIIEMLDE